MSILKKLFGPNQGEVGNVESDRDHRLKIPVVDALSDEELCLLNKLLPWNCFIRDSKGRQFGKAFSSTKRNQTQIVPDSRIVEFNNRFSLEGKRVLELGCFEGIHTIALAQTGAIVTAVDARIEHVCKTIVRCGLFQLAVTVHIWDVEKIPPENLCIECDYVSHIGVLYHLVDPVSHLQMILPHVRHGMLLDTHIAPENKKLSSYSIDGQSYAYFHFNEAGRRSPFAGMYRHAKWLTTSSLITLIQRLGFTCEVIERRNERNGPRVLIHAIRIKEG
jgi:tRNA (mo5U34)-methyltransferase